MKVFKIRGIVITIIIAIITIVLGVWIQYFFLYEDVPNEIKITDVKGKHFDYIIVGSGTAGSVVASELARKRKLSSILLIEAGEKFGKLSKIPLLATFLQQTKNDWGFKSTPQRYSSKGFIKKQQQMARGKGLGGSSQMNFLLHFNGYKKDFDNWENLGATNWSYDIMKYYLQDIFPSLPSQKNNVNSSKSRLSSYNSFNNNRTNNSKLLTIPKDYSILTEIFEKCKFEFIGRKLNFRRAQYNVKNGERWNVYQMYLKPAFKLRNFRILLNSYVEKITFNYDKSVKSVFVRNKFVDNGNELIEIFANKEIILSAGAYNTPQILQLSGIGHKDLLDYMNVDKIVYESPKVGTNLFEHLNIPLYISISAANASITFNKIMNPKEIWNYFRYGKGVYTNLNVLGYITKYDENYETLFFGTGSIDESVLSISNFKANAFRSLFPLYYNRNQEGFTMLSICLQPLSRGSVQAVTNKIMNYPLIDLNLLKNEYDVNCTIKAIRTAVSVVKSKSFKKLNPTIHWPILKECLDYGPYKEDMITNYPSHEYLDCLIRTVGLASHHPGGTCAIGNTSDSCVDNALRVQGVTGLRVVDASVLPSPVSGPPNSVIIAVAKRAVDLILNKK